MRCYDCGGAGPSGGCAHSVITCGEGERCGFLERAPQAGLAQSKLNRECAPSPSGLQALRGLPEPARLGLVPGRWASVALAQFVRIRPGQRP